MTCPDHTKIFQSQDGSQSHGNAQKVGRSLITRILCRGVVYSKTSRFHMSSVAFRCCTCEAYRA